MKLIIAVLAVLAMAGIAEADRLITFDEHWNHRYNLQDIIRSAHTGIACPVCGAELKADYSLLLTSNPPKTRAWCEKCEWEGFI
jgi:hypothetical protein